MLAALTLLSILSFGTTAFADKHDAGWFDEYDGRHYYNDYGEQPYAETVAEIDGESYYFNYRGAVQTGWIEIDASYTDPDTGRLVEETIWYYADADGVLLDGWQKIGGVWYYFEPEAYFMYANGIYVIGSDCYAFKASGAMVTGWHKVSYTYEESGQTIVLWFYAKSSGPLATGWQKIGGKWYYFDPDECRMYDNTAEKIDGKLYFFKPDGAMLANGWGKDSRGDWYYAGSDGALATGWQKISGKWYYFSTDGGFMYVGGVRIGQKIYLFGSDGAWIDTAKASGWKQVNYSYAYEGVNYKYDEWYYVKNGAVATGWQKIGGKWYLFSESNGYMYKACAYRADDSKVYFFESSGAMKTSTGWAKELYNDGSFDWFYVYSNGVCATGWKKIGGKWYYFDPDWAYMFTGFNRIDGKWYCFNSDGEMLTGKQNIDGEPYIFGDDGALISGDLPGSVG